MIERPVIGVVGLGAMGLGIAQVYAQAGFPVLATDAQSATRENAKTRLADALTERVIAGKLTAEKREATLCKLTIVNGLQELKPAVLIVEAINETIAAKRHVFAELDSIIAQDAVLATNTSSLSVTSIAAACLNPGRVIGVHFFNPAPLMPLVEIIKGVETDSAIANETNELISGFGKTTVLAKDSPGFIVNRVARSYYGESIRIYEEGLADFATIDWAMKEFGKFRMGPFELMDLIGNDINYTVTETVWKQCFYDPRYKPSLTQRLLFEAKHFGKKTGRGYYDYSEGAVVPEPKRDKTSGEKIFMRVLSMLINEAVDALYFSIASREDLDLAMKKGVNYPKGLLQWCDEIGAEKILHLLNELNEEYAEDRYRPSVLLKKMVKEKKRFYE